MPNFAPVSRYRIAELGALLADPTRVAMLLALVDGSARPAGELARRSGVAAATASAHLSRLLEGGLLAVRPQGRHRYFRLADDEVAHLIESLMAAGNLESRPLLPVQPRATPALREARLCYRHLAGHMGVVLYDAFLRRELITVTAHGMRLSQKGILQLQALELLNEDDGHLNSLSGRPCLDWTERRDHLGGSLGVALCERLFAQRWLRTRADSRAVMLTASGREHLQTLGVQ